MRNPKRFKISYKKGHDLFPTSQREEEEARATQKYERERERETLDKLGSRRGGAKESQGGKLGSKKRDKKQKARSLDKLGSRRGTKTKSRELGKQGSLQVCY